MTLDENDDFPACASYQPDVQLEQTRLMSQLQACLAQLPEAQRAVLVLKLESELSLVELAQQLNIAFEALKSRFRYAQAKLQRCLGVAEQ
jgi:RNA polymerase sigma-70 factor (ECF subfamily)